MFRLAVRRARRSKPKGPRRMQSAAPHREAELLVRFRAGISHTTRKLLSEMSQEDAYANISFEKEAAEYARNNKGGH